MKIPKDILFGQEAREKILKGVNIVAEAVGSTLGPKGNNVAINYPQKTPEIIHDGVGVARRINLKDPFEDMGAEFIKSVAEKTVAKVGDGTTTSTVLAQAIITEALKQIASGVKPQDIKRDLEAELPILLKKLEGMTKQIKSDDEIENVATISASDRTLGKIVADAIKKVGKEGIVTIEEGKGFDTTVEYKSGMEVDNGYLASDFETDPDRQEAVIKNPYILMTDKDLRYNRDIVGFLDKFLDKEGERRDLVIFASTVEGEAMTTLALNTKLGKFRCLCVRAPAFGERRRDELEDMAVYTGGKFITTNSGQHLSTVEIADLGRAEKVVADRDKTLIINGKGNKEALDKRAETIRAQIAVANTDFDRDIKERRLSNLTGKAATIYVGAIDETNMIEKRERVIDAKNATLAAIRDGIVAGGEITLYTLSKSARGILKNALTMPFKKLLDNAGIDYAQALQGLGEYPMGIDVMDGKAKNMLEAGIIDPAGVTKSALQNAVSIAGIVITTGCLITDYIKEE